MIIIIVFVIVLFIVVRSMRSFKRVKFANLCLFTGGVKTGKTTFSVYKAVSTYKRIHLKWKLTHWYSKKEEPLFYSNIPVRMKYVPLTCELLNRSERFRFGSVIFVDEASLVADSLLGMKLKEEDLQEKLNLFNKLIGHETHGGYLFYNSQSVSDLHNSIKRSIGSYFYVHHCIKWIPFILVFKVREMTYCDQVSTVDVSDNEDTLKWCIVPKRIWKVFDHYAFSSFTDDLPCSPVVVDNRKAKSLKVTDLVTFRIFNTIKKGKK